MLDEARKMMARLPFEQIDLLVIGEIGKNYSGAGIDPNVVGRLLIETQAETERPSITRICCLDLSPESHGNATGVGIADLTTERLLSAIDPVPFRMNNLTACFLWRSKLPIAFANDRDCIDMGMQTCWQPNHDALRLAVIPNTLELTDLWVSAPLLHEAGTRATSNRRADSGPCRSTGTTIFSRKNCSRIAFAEGMPDPNRLIRGVDSGSIFGETARYAVLPIPAPNA